METPEKDPQEPQSLTHQAIKLYMKTGHLHRDVLEKEVRQTSVYRSQHQILMYLSNHPEASQKDIAEFFGCFYGDDCRDLKKTGKSRIYSADVRPERQPLQPDFAEHERRGYCHTES